jgi:hypothetical protein
MALGRRRFSWRQWEPLKSAPILPDLRALIGAKIRARFFFKRATEGAAKLIEDQVRRSEGRKVARADGAVSQEVECEPCTSLVPLLVTTLTTPPAELPYSAEVAGLDLELLNGFERGPHHPAGDCRCRG